MKFALTISAVAGLAWSFLVVLMIGGDVKDGLRLSFLLAGITAGLVAGVHTVRTRSRKGGADRIFSVLACYYIAIVAYWAVWLVVERVSMCIEFRSWTDFDLHDHLNMIWIYLLYGTIPYGLVLIPLCFLNRWLVWWAFNSRAV